jgi:acyl carrier protein
MSLSEVQVVLDDEPADDRLRRTIAAALNVAADELSEESSPDTIAAWDSLNHLNIVMAIEGEFDVALSADDVMEMRNVGLIRTILRQHGVDAAW